MHDTPSPRPAGNPFPDHGVTPPPVQLALEPGAANHVVPLARAREAWDDVIAAGLTWPAERVYLRLAHHADRNGLARRSAAGLAHELGLIPTNVRRELRGLARRGFIVPVALVEGVLVDGGPPRYRIGYRLPAMVAPIRPV